MRTSMLSRATLGLAFLFGSLSAYAAPSLTVVLVGVGASCEAAKTDALAQYASSSTSYTSYEAEAHIFPTKAAAATWCAAEGWAADAPTFPDIESSEPGWTPLGSDTVVETDPTCGIDNDGNYRVTREIFAVCFDPAS